MNKNRYRIIYNKARQMFMAVAENAKSQTKTSGQSTSSVATPTSEESFHQLWHVKALVASMSLWMPLSTVYAGMMADTGANAANRPVIGVGQDAQKQNVPVINIQTPNASGVSHNIYKEFDVPTQGAVLNNSRTGAASSIVGSVAANPYLQTGEARIILNEVNSAIASKFEGNLEIAGQQADLIIANPAGINIKGGGFINANKAILTTGKPQLNADGSIKEFVVDQGKITVSANAGSNLGLGGATNNNANYIDLYTRALELNAQLFAKNDIQVITGTNTISADLNKVENKTSTATAPTVAIDVKALGGMYANNIYMVGTEKGLGVNNAGTLQAVNNLVITSAGKIEHSGLISSTSKTQGLVSITTSETGAAGDINSSGSINSNSMLNIDSANNLNVNAKDILINYGGVASSPMLINAKGNLNLAANTRIMNDSVGGDLFVDAANINLGTSSELKSNRGSATIQAQQDLTSSASARLIAAQDLNVLGKGKLSFTNTLLHASLGSINLQSGSSNTQGLIDIQAGTINAAKDLNLSSSGDINLKNLGLAVENSVSLVKNINAYSGQNLKWDNTNIALPQIAGKVQLDAANQLDLIGNSILNQDDINLQANKINLNTALTSQKNINITAKTSDLILNRGLTAQGDINVSALAGNINANSLNVVSNQGKLSILAQKDITLTSLQETTPTPSADKDQVTTKQAILKAEKGITIGSLGEGKLALKAVELTANQGTIQLLGKNGVNLEGNEDIYITGDTGRSRIVNTKLTAQEILLENKKSDVNLKQTNLLATTGNIAVSSEGETKLVGTNLKASGNIELSAKKNLTIQSTNAVADKHMALNAKNLIYISSELDSPYTNYIANSQTNLTAQGVLSMISGSSHVTHNANYTGGAILLEAGSFLMGLSNVQFNATGSDLLRNDTKLNSLNGDLSILQTTNDLILDPKKQKFTAFGDMDFTAKAGAVKLLGYGGTAGNGSEQIVKLNSATGGINLAGKSVELQGASVTAAKDISIVSTGGDLIVDGVKNILTNQVANSESVVRIKSKNQNILNQIEKLKTPDISKDYEVLINLYNEAYPFALSNEAVIDKKIKFDKAYTDFLVKYPALEPKSYVWEGEKKFFPFNSVVWEPTPDSLGMWRPWPAGLYDNFAAIYSETDIQNLRNEINFYNSRSNGYEHKGSDIVSATGNINLVSKQGVSISGATIDAKKGSVLIEAAGTLANQEHQIQGEYKSDKLNSVKQGKIKGSIIIDATQDSYEIGQATDENYNWRSPINSTSINGDKGVKIKATGETATDNLILQGVGITSNNGNVDVEAYKNIIFDVAVENSYDKSKKTETKRKWYGKKKTITTITTAERVGGVSVDIEAKNINIKSKEPKVGEQTGPHRTSIDMYSSQLTANGGKVTILAGGDINLLTADNISKDTLDISKSSSWAGIKLNKSKYTSTRNIKSELPAVLEASYIGAQADGSIILKGTEFNYLESAEIKAGETISLLTASKLVEETLNKKSNSVVWQSMQDKGSITETAKLPSFNGPTTPVFQAAGGLIVQVPVGEKNQNKVELRDEIMKLANQPGNAYLKDFVNRKDVDWQKVILAQKDWDYKSQGLTAAGAAILAIVVAIATAGAGAAALGTTTTLAGGGTVTTFGGITLATTAAGGATTFTAAGAMINAAVTSIATQASVGLVNNQGNVSKTLKDLGSKENIKSLATSIATAGVLSQLADTKIMQDINGLTKTGSFVTDLTARTTQGVMNAGATTLVDFAINGGSLSEKLSTALLLNTANSLQGALSVQIKGLENSDYLLHKIAHAAAGCVSAIVAKANCEAGAIGAAVGEIVAEEMDRSIGDQNFKTDQDILDYQQKVRSVSKLVAGTIAGLTGYDVNTAANTAEIAIANNRQLRQSEVKRIELLAKGNANQQARLSIAACAMVKCAEGYEGTTEYSFLKAIQDAGLSDTFKVERDLLVKQNFRVSTGGFVNIDKQLFDYTLLDRGTDKLTSIYNPLDRDYKITNRATGILMVAGGATGVTGSTALGSTCITGAGCVLALGGFVASADLTVTGLNQTLYGKPSNTLGAQAISATTGLSLNQSELVYGLLGLASVTNAVRSSAKEAVTEGRVLVNKPVASCTNGTTCFVAGALIETEQGLKPIESFVGGELVWSKSDKDFTYHYQPVVATKVTHNQPIYEIIVENDFGVRETFLTTEEHPFWVKDVGWQKASILRHGNILLDRNNKDIKVISQVLLAKLDTVYNIEVDHYHTYHVGQLGIWVHNANCCDLVYQNIVKETKYGVISNRKLDRNAIELDLTSTTSNQAKQIAQKGDPLGAKTEVLFENVVKEQGGKVLSGGKYGSNNGYDHVIVFKDAQGNINLTMVVDSKQLGQKGIKLDPKAAGGNMQMSGEWDAAVLAKLDKNSEAYKAIIVAQKNGTLVKGAAYVDKSTEKLMLVRIDPTTKK